MSRSFNGHDAVVGRRSKSARLALTSGLAMAVLAVGAGATWANTGGEPPAGTAPAAGSVTRPVAPPDELRTPDASATSVAAGGPDGSATTDMIGGSEVTSGSDPIPPSDSAAASAAGQIELRGPDGLPATPVRLTVGGRLVVHLAEQAGSTGYSWVASSVPSRLVRAGDRVVPPAPKPGAPVVGAAADHVFTFRAATTGNGTLTFTLQRPWSGEAARRVSVKITVAPAGRTVEVRGPQGLPKSVVAIKVGDKIVVRLSEQAGSTGYSWSATSVPRGLTLTGDRVVPGVSRPGASGVPGEHVFTFRADRAGNGRISFTLQRPWESAAASKVTLAVQIRG